MLAAGIDAYRLVEVLPDVPRASAQTRLASRRPAPPAARSRMHSRAQLQIVRSASSLPVGAARRPEVASRPRVRRRGRGCRHGAQGRCLPYEGGNHPLAAVRSASRCRSRRGRARRPRRPASKSLFERLAVQRPLVVVLEDLHWAEAALLDGMEHVAESSRGAAILIIAVARPELLEARPGWGVESRTRARPSSNHSARSTGSSTTSWANPTFPIPFARTSSERPTAIRSSSRSCSRRSSTEIC